MSDFRSSTQDSVTKRQSPASGEQGQVKFNGYPAVHFHHRPKSSVSETKNFHFESQAELERPRMSDAEFTPTVGFLFQPVGKVQEVGTNNKYKLYPERGLPAPPPEPTQKAGRQHKLCWGAFQVSEPNENNLVPLPQACRHMHARDHCKQDITTYNLK